MKIHLDEKALTKAIGLLLSDQGYRGGIPFSVVFGGRLRWIGEHHPEILTVHVEVTIGETDPALGERKAGG